VSHDHDAQELIGTRYKIVDDIRAYGVRPHSSAPADYVVLTAPPGFAGPEVAFEEMIQRGAVITVSGVLKTSRIFENPYTLIVQLDSTALRTALPVKVALYGNNEGPTRLSLNPAFYQRLAPAEPTMTKTKNR